MAVRVKAKPRINPSKLFADPDHVLQLIAQAKDPNESLNKRDKLAGLLRGFKNFYKTVGKLESAAYIDRELHEIKELIRADS